MTIQDLQKLYSKSPKVAALGKAVEDVKLKNIFLDGLVASSAPLAFAAMALKTTTTMLFVLNDADEAGYFYHDLTQIMGEKNVLFFPSSYRRAIKYGQRDSASEILRTEVLSAIMASKEMKGESLYVVTHPEAIAELVVSRQKLDERTLQLHTDETIDVSDIVKTLRQFGFREVDYVYEPGQFARRGSIIDVYSYSCEYPFRIDFFGDDIDSIRTFEVDTQLSRDKRSSIEIVPELAVESSEKVPILDFLPDNTLMAMRDVQYVCDIVSQVYDEGFSSQAITERMESATEMERAELMKQMERSNQLVSPSEFKHRLLDFRTIEFGHRSSLTSNAIIHFNISSQPLFHKNFDLIKQCLDELSMRGFKLYILADSHKQIERLKEILASPSPEGEGSDCLQLNSVNRQTTDGGQGGFTLHEGFCDNDMKLCLFTDHQIFDRFHKYNLRSDKARSGKVALTLKEIKQFEVGDYVVHVDHGIGKFGGLVRMPQDDGYQEMIKIQYQNGDSIYVSIHSLYKVSKYKAQDNGEPPRLSHLGTGQWERLKERTKKKIKDIARDLIKLYSRRRHEKGYAYSHDSFMQHELEASFLYEDTPDQLKATNEVKADMESQKPMDRLVCGDVGFGKTEVAVRAAFKAACDSKQVAVLVPTTVLAYQHYQTFSKRLKDLPVRVEYLTRAKSTKQTNEVLKDLADGKIDILIGTQKLIGKSVKFKDLGLLIIDEEQKFGVATKEKLRQMKTNVDTLTMSATPIPRTLQFSLVGARDMSVIQTPPPNRYPIQTEIHTFGPEIIADAINFEMSRNGQVYFVNNRINDLTRMAEMIGKYVPDVRIAIGHGQMKPEELEKIILGFANYDYDVLLSTTIVENGIDIPNANTIIINGAHNFGLSDLHQMRGRVGRGNRKAFCYLLAPPLSALNPESRRRLEALENFSDLGSGINIAMQDLDIRGAGNLLGAEQSGFIADLGYETYQKILNQAVTELKNDEFADLYKDEAEANALTGEYFVDDCALESDIEMYFPDQYVPNDSERMLLYRELDSLKDDDELKRYKLRMIDRFGDIPAVAEELMQVVPLRRYGKRLGCEKIMLKKQRMTLFFVSNPRSAYYQSHTFGLLLDYIAENPRRCNLREANGKRSMIIENVKTVEEGVATLKQIMKSKPC
ncbi:MAG: transcription-repair coupling factor [Prevotellaceae bacterium]|nr:transcription-repair coupling factor [Prevotellaceae bacterium]